jgi:hypothetical protein
MSTVSVNIDVDVHLDDIDTDELLDELEGRGYKVLEENEHDLDEQGTELITAIFEKRRQSEDYQKELDYLIFKYLGRVL